MIPTVLLTGTTEQGIRAALAFARRVAQAENGRLIVLHVASSYHGFGLEVEEPEWLTQLIPPDFPVPTATKSMALVDIPEAIEYAVRSQPIELAIAAASATEVEALPFRNLVAAPPCPLLVLANSPANFSPNRVLMATNTFGRLTEQATRLSYILPGAEDGTTVTFLRLVPPGTPDDEIAAIDEGIRRRIAERQPPFAYDVIVRKARSFESGILDTLHDGEYDLAIADTPRQGVVARLAERVVPERLVEHPTPVMLYAVPTGKAARTFLRTWNRVYGLIPSLSEADRTAVYSGIRRNSRYTTDFYVLLTLSVVMASVGMIMDNIVVVLGAMLVAPLMQPLLGIGLGVATGNARLSQLAIRTAVFGVLLTIVLSLVIGVLIPPSSLTGELDSRGQPTVLDLLAALASGAAGAYAVSRKDIAISVVGVAIAVALVPPLATVGIGLALREYYLAFGAGLLFLTNFAAICAASAVMFLWLGFKPEVRRLGRHAAFAQGAVALASLVAVVAVSLVAWDRASDGRAEERIFAAVQSAVQGVDPESSLDSIRIDRDGSVLAVSASVTTAIPADVRQNNSVIQSDVARQLDRPVALSLVTLVPEEEED